MGAVYLLLSKCLIELCKLYKYRPITKGLCSKRYTVSMVNTVDFHSFLLVDDRYMACSVIL